MVADMGGAILKPMMEELGLLELIKIINLDEITVSIVSPQFKNGLVHSLKLSGITEILHNKFLV